MSLLRLSYRKARNSALVILCSLNHLPWEKPATMLWGSDVEMFTQEGPEANQQPREELGSHSCPISLIPQGGLQMSL